MRKFRDDSEGISHVIEFITSFIIFVILLTAFYSAIGVQFPKSNLVDLNERMKLVRVGNMLINEEGQMNNSSSNWEDFVGNINNIENIGRIGFAYSDQTAGVLSMKKINAINTVLSSGISPLEKALYNKTSELMGLDDGQYFNLQMYALPGYIRDASFEEDAGKSGWTYNVAGNWTDHFEGGRSDYWSTEGKTSYFLRWKPVYDGKEAAQPCFLYNTSTWTSRIYYMAHDGGNGRILSANSTDNITWTKENSVKIEVGGTYDKLNATSPFVLKLLDNSYRMYYAGNDSINSRILSATSVDGGITWNKDSGVRLNNGGTYDLDHASTPFIYKFSDTSYRMYYSGGVDSTGLIPSVHIFGGNTAFNWLDETFKFNPSTETVTTLPATLPTARTGTSAIWSGQSVYIFGGFYFDGSDHYLDQIVKFNPASGTMTTLSAKLPTGRVDTSAIWDGTNAYIFGGSSGGNQIIKFNPSTESVTTLPATLPSARYATSAIWDGTNAYIFGGMTSGTTQSDQILKFNPSTETITTLLVKLPTARGYMSAIWDGSNAYIFGGTYYDGTGFVYLDQIIKFNPTSGTVTTLPATLPSSRAGTSAAVSFTTSASSQWRILSATSTDGLSWTKQPGITIDIGGTYDKTRAYSPSVIKLPNNTYQMFYSGMDASLRSNITSAWSSDGITWSKSNTVHITPSSTSINVSSPSVTVLPNNTYRVYYTESDGISSRILSAFSKDGFVWTKEGGTRIDKGNVASSTESCKITTYVNLTNTMGIAFDVKMTAATQKNIFNYSMVLSNTTSSQVMWSKRDIEAVEAQNVYINTSNKVGWYALDVITYSALSAGGYASESVERKIYIDSFRPIGKKLLEWGKSYEKADNIHSYNRIVSIYNEDNSQYTTANVVFTIFRGIAK
jgi:predicted GH43/DUF377 family glycosyl hydrolase